MNSKDYNSQMPLLWVSENGHELVVKLLLEKGAELETKDDKLYSRTLLSHTAGNVNSTDYEAKE